MNTIWIQCIQAAVNALNDKKAAGYDLLTAEHLKFCHPIVWSCLSDIFSVMLHVGFVPDSFGIGITVPLLKSDSKGSTANSDAYRGITIMPIIFKVSEALLLRVLEPFISSSDSQFGFKKGFSFSHAIYTVRKTVGYFNLANSTVNLCALDISKAFDKINHLKLFSKLMDRNVPVNIILLLISWY